MGSNPIADGALKKALTAVFFLDHFLCCGISTQRLVHQKKMPTAIPLSLTYRTIGILLNVSWGDRTDRAVRHLAKRRMQRFFLMKRLGVTPEPYAVRTPQSTKAPCITKRCGQQSQGYRQQSGGTFQPHLEKGTNSIHAPCQQDRTRYLALTSRLRRAK